MAPMAENRIRRFSGRAIRGLEKVMFEAADPAASAWYLKNYGPEVNLFVDHNRVCADSRLDASSARQVTLVLLAALAARADRAQTGEGRSAARWVPHARMPSTHPPVAEDPPRSDSRSRRPPNERARSDGFARPTVHGRRVPLP